MTPYTIGFDVGGTRLKSGGVTQQGKLLVQGVASSGAHFGPEVLLELLAGEVERISRKAKAKPDIRANFHDSSPVQKNLVLDRPHYAV
jgi:hypothetical protein